MNYVLFYKGLLPNYYKICLNSILSAEKEANIILCSEKSVENTNINYLNINDITSENTNEIINLSVYKDTTYDEKINPLWLNSLLRIFYLRDIANELSIDKFIHFDLDVITYKSFDEVQHLFHPDKLNITEHIDNTPIFGYSYFPKLSIINKICFELENYLKNENTLNKKISNFRPLNEMELLKIIKERNSDLFYSLPTLPYNNNELVFDPATYGQYLGGLPNKPYFKFRKKHTSLSHIVGKEISSGRIKPVFQKKPSVLYDSTKIDIVNLHIHSKNLNKFKPYNYQEIIS